ncbi:MAG: response regulator [Blautia sp.]|nr:response regulator [Blautia sp.]
MNPFRSCRELEHWLMPDMNGIEMVRRIRKVLGDSTPIIILTAYDWSDIEDEAREAGVTAFFLRMLFRFVLQNRHIYLKKRTIRFGLYYV